MRLKRCLRNPILKPIANNKWESGAVFNCGAVYQGGQLHLLYRAIGEYEHYVSRLGYALGKDGINFERKDKPVFGPRKSYEKWGCEDPRITKIDDTFYLTYVALSKPAREGGGPPRTALALTKDFIHFVRLGVITPESTHDRDVVLFPEKINNQYLMLHRPLNWIEKNIRRKGEELYLKKKELIYYIGWPFIKRLSQTREKWIKWPLKEKPDYFPAKPGIWIAYSTDLKEWFGHKVVMEPKEKWESVKIGAGPPPIKTEEGWLLIYHGVGEEKGISKYSAGAALLDLKDPSKVIARLKKPILEPEKDYEMFGDVATVVFPEGAAVINRELFVYYGAADKTCSLATCNLDELIDALVKEKQTS